MEGLDRLNVWKTAKDLAVQIYQQVIPLLPVEEKYGLTLQIRRAATSVPANIAEVYNRYYFQEGIHFCYLACGSLMELMSHLELAEEMSWVSNSLMTGIQSEADVLLKLIHGYVRYLKNCKRGHNEPGLGGMISDCPLLYEVDPANSVDDSIHSP